MTRVAIMGGGSWGTAFAVVLAEAGSQVTLWTRDGEMAADINQFHRNSRYHPDVDLPESIIATTDPQEALQSAEIVVLAVPAQSLRANLKDWAQWIRDEAVFVSLMKGIELGTSMRMSEVIAQATGADPQRIAVVSGPNLAKEIIARQPTATTVAASTQASAVAIQRACTTDYFRPYWTTDVIGTEIGGAVKNVIAVANGIAVGMGLGENSQSSLITRGLAEIGRLGVALGADPLTFLGLAGVGDLVATCQSPLSRNRTFGENLGRGLSVKETIAVTNQTCEAFKSCQPILELAQKLGVEMPITAEVVAVLHFDKPPRDLLSSFMARDTKSEL
ncbi:MAG: NAD(P)-dependent glycerol-3-phosphate dehydrogenase [Candidatus Nanopelagicales bacterium]|nr:NAD(P)-dependent glycerol-3-phosphate dehydrogenase [Candidatus Nanopelagicales bacterium]